VLQFLVLAGELPQLALELLDPHLRIAIVGLRQRARRQRLRSQRQHRGQRQCARDPAGSSAGSLVTSG
jgi:hypothetical protein